MCHTTNFQLLAAGIYSITTNQIDQQNQQNNVNLETVDAHLNSGFNLTSFKLPNCVSTKLYQPLI